MRAGLNQASLRSQGSTTGSHISGIPATATAALEDFKFMGVMLSALEGAASRADSVTPMNFMSITRPVDALDHDCVWQPLVRALR